MDKLSDTIELMISESYDDRLKAEYYQLGLRIVGLTKMLESYKNGTLSFTPKCSYTLLKSQLNSMEHYANILEVRAETEGIDLRSL